MNEDIKDILARFESNPNKQMWGEILELFETIDDLDTRVEIIYSIGLQDDKEKVLKFLKDNVYQCGFMELVYQMFRVCIYNEQDPRFRHLQAEMLDYFDNEMMYKMKKYHDYRQTRHKFEKVEKIQQPILLEGNNLDTLGKIKDNQVQLVFTSPPYYNARQYSDYKSYAEYLNEMEKTLVECHRVLEDGRFIVINISPVITKRPSREFESIRYPIHFDFHKILEKAGFYFIDEIIWIKPDYSVPNRVGGYHRTRLPLTYKPNCVTESILVYRKDADFLIDKNIKVYDKGFGVNKDASYDSTNCWYIHPKSDRNHPAIFPEELCEKVLKYYSFPNDVVLDVFGGSGTVGRVALRMDRVPILCERNEKYIELIKRDGEYTSI